MKEIIDVPIIIIIIIGLLSVDCKGAQDQKLKKKNCVPLYQH